MEVASNDTKVLTGRFKVKDNGNYTIKFRSTGGQLTPSPVVYEIIAIPDRPRPRNSSSPISRLSRSPSTSSSTS